MKTKMILLLLAAMTTLFACSKDDDGGVDPNDPEAMRTIKLSAKAFDYVDFDLEHDGRDQYDCCEFISTPIPFPTDLFINWGDGGITSSDSYQYSRSGTYNITIQAKNLKWFKASSNYAGSYFHIHSIDFKDCNSLVGIDLDGEDLITLNVANMKALEYLDCGYNDLTSLDIKGCSSLTYVDCSHNELSAEVLNKIFSDLPQGKTWIGNYGDKLQSTIYFAQNPGEDTCDKSIAEKKGWKTSRW